jgi:hypothetical protein
MHLVRVLLIAVAIIALLSQSRAETATVPGVGYASITMDYTFDLGPSLNTFTVNSVSVTVGGGSSSGYFGLLPEHSFFTLAEIAKRIAIRD